MAMHIAPPELVEVDDGIANQLTGCVIGDIATSADFEEFNANLAQTRFAFTQIGSVGTAAQGDDGGMFEKQETIGGSSSQSIRHRFVLKCECVGIGDLPQPFDR